ncbi:MAG: Rieske 2Fe-2S domain-containing protein [Nitrospirota bacterium]|nr:Rieske 2Fe-2S domain-containing protein [Nitrospirota bacterium]
MKSVTVKYAAKNDNEGQLVVADGQEIALFKLEGQFYAVENRCPHRGGYLADGSVRGHNVTCPLHGWTFDLTSGQSLTRPDQRIGCFQISASGDDVTIALD